MRTRVCQSLAGVLVWIGVSALQTFGATFTVTDLADGNPAPAGSLREAIASANASAGLDFIVFDGALMGTITLTEGALTLSDELIIFGPGADVLTVSGDNAGRVFLVNGTTAQIEGLTIADGLASGSAGGGVAGNGGLKLVDCEIVGCTASTEGGGIVIFEGSLEADGCTFTGNQASNGGAIWFGQGATLTAHVTLRNCTFQGNIATNNGGAVRQSNSTAYTTEIVNCTLSGNSAGNGGGIAIAGGVLTLRNTLVAGNTASSLGPDIRTTGGTLSSAGYNLVGNNASSGFTATTGDQVGTSGSPLNPNLEPLGANGGGTRTMLPMSDSLAIDRGTNTGAPLTDQRGLPRPVGCSADVGAVEVQTPSDADMDGTPDVCDGCPSDPAKTAPGICGCGVADTDSDTDGVADCLDGCPLDADKLDPGFCGCGMPDVDTDGDGILDCDDACSMTPACAVVDETGCPADSDGDMVFDGCDQCPGTLAGDPVDANGCSTGDEDGDGVLNDEDQCRGTPPCAVASVDAQGCPADADGDGLFDGCDQCPGEDDLADGDGDGIPDCLDPCPSGIDTDGDGVQDCQDGCPDDPLKFQLGVCGCGVVDSDTDGDGVLDCLTLDLCPNDPEKSQPGACGCGVPDTDANANGIPDCFEQGDPTAPTDDQDGQTPQIVISLLPFPFCGIVSWMPLLALVSAFVACRRTRRRHSS